ncbi:SatD family (SatD) [Nocardioides exalbidus]|uniref:SatD family (SatD) n=1 Tax=Nocardioides exalbidus TaxID=402596 RepID=A0A1H4W7J9_9ACTN|nr:SatD family protein [Nocardioides exalbidus]SEC89342.1 SatD family (SatD) [Nocardioides exalbidus]
MRDMKSDASVTVIGDLVGSRRSEDRAAVHARFVKAVDEVNADFAPPVPLRIGVGDEFQGIFDGLGSAVAATLRLRLALLPDVDVRQGIGWGRVQVLSEEPRVEDGPGWWAARSAIEVVEGYERKAALRAVRTAYVAADDEPGPDEAAINAALMTRDQVVSGLSDRSLSVLDGLLRDRQQQEIADELGISPSAVSQRIRADGIGVVLAADELMRRVTG